MHQQPTVNPWIFPSKLEFYHMNLEFGEFNMKHLTFNTVFFVGFRSTFGSKPKHSHSRWRKYHTQKLFKMDCNRFWKFNLINGNSYCWIDEALKLEPSSAHLFSLFRFFNIDSFLIGWLGKPFKWKLIGETANLWKYFIHKKKREKKRIQIVCMWNWGH